MSVYEGLSESKQFACRVIADHARATAFSIADGILPGNEGRNYVLRKIMRRAIYHGREHLGLKDAFFYKVCDLVVDRFAHTYPELAAQRDFIGKMVRLEEERFGNTLTTGLGKFSDIDEYLDQLRDEELLFDESFAIPLKPSAKKSFIFSKDSRLKGIKLIYPDGSEVMEDPNSISPGERQQLEQQYREISKVLEARKQLGGFSNTGEFQRQIREAQRIKDLLKDFPPVNPELLKGLQAIRPFLDDFHKQELFRKLAGLYDTFGIPRDLMRVKLEQNGLEFGEQEFAEDL